MQSLEPLTDEDIYKLRLWIRKGILLPPEMLDRALEELQERRQND